MGELHAAPPRDRSEPFVLLCKKPFQITFSMLSSVLGTGAIRHCRLRAQSSKSLLSSGGDGLGGTGVPGTAHPTYSLGLSNLHRTGEDFLRLEIRILISKM